MKKVFLVHGFKATPNGGWRPWLLEELSKIHIYAHALAMPSPSSPSCSEWIDEIAREVDRSKRDQIYLVGHSLGSTAILRFLEKTKAKNIKGVLLVSSPSIKASKKKVGGFLNDPFDYKSIVSKADKYAVIHARDDRSVPFVQGQYLAEQLGVKLIVIEKGGHLNGSAGFDKLPQCLEELKKMF